jgi:CheY-like chemotaxis protein
MLLVGSGMEAWNNVAGRVPRILCVDDDQSILSITRMALEYEGYNVVTASNGRAALEQFAAGPVDAVVLDYEMPGMNGAEVAREMKRLKPAVPKLLFTSCPTVPKQAADAIEAFCPKGVSLDVLLSRVHLLVETPVGGKPN